jgi:2-oxoisovalerate dehydrogenase E2 component (dihydrolipoyl transacylase)
VPKDFVLPELAESIVEGEVVRWLVAEGDAVAMDQPIVEVMTDKVTVELPAPVAGVVERIVAVEGAVVAVGALLATIDTDAGAVPRDAGAARSGAVADRPAVSPPATESPASSSAAAAADGGPEAGTEAGDEVSLFRARSGSEAPLPKVRRRSAGSAEAAVGTPTAAAALRGGEALRGAYGRVVAVPAARRLARELGVPIEQVLGSGPLGRVRVDDVRAQRGSAGAASAGLPVPIRPTTPKGYEARERRIPLRGVRRAVAHQMVASHLHTVRTLHVDEADVSELVRLRERLKPRAEARGVRLSYLPLIMKAVAQVLPGFPALASAYDAVTQEIVLRDYVNLGMAVSTDLGLVVPVVRDVDRKALIDVADELQTLAAKARDGRLAPDDVRGGTFSITNIGSVGGLFSFPIINVPEAAILGVHAIRKRPVVADDDAIVVRPMLYLSLSFDHRLVDGADAARFTNELIGLLEVPDAMLLDA